MQGRAWRKQQPSDCRSQTPTHLAQRQPQLAVQDLPKPQHVPAPRAAVCTRIVAKRDASDLIRGLGGRRDLEGRAGRGEGQRVERRRRAKEMQHGAAAASVRPPPWRPAPHLALLPGVDARAVLHASELGGEGQACGSLEGLVVAPGACRDGAQRRTVRVAVTLLAVQRCPCRALQRLARGPVGTPASSRRLASSGLGSSGWTRQTPSAKAAGARRSPSRAGSASDMLWWRGGASRSAGREGGT